MSANEKDYPDRTEAEEILNEAEEFNPGLWAEHSRIVARCAEEIADACGLDSEKAYVLGLLHDIGRRAGSGQLKHVYYGWLYMTELGYPAAAQICLTHSYNTQRFEDDIAGIDIEPEQVEEIKAALAACTYDDYDRLIQFCNSIATAYGAVDINEWMSDIIERYGKNPQPKLEKNVELMNYFEIMAGKRIGEMCSGI